MVARVRAHGKSDNDFDAELASHIALHTEDGMRAGLSRQEARRQAFIRLGGAEQTRQAYRERRTLPWIEELLQDVRFGLRMMARNRGFTAVAVLTLAIGIGATATAFTWIDAVLLQPLSGVTEPNRLVTAGVSHVQWRMGAQFLSRLHRFSRSSQALRRHCGHPHGSFQRRQRESRRACVGRTRFRQFLCSSRREARSWAACSSHQSTAMSPGAYPVAVISDRYWRSHYGADPSIVGRTIRINQHELTIVGVAAPEFHGSMPVTSFDLWVPYMEQSVLNGVQLWMLRDRHDRNMLGIARLKPGVTFEQARLELKTLADRMAIANANVSEGMSATLLPLWKSPHGPQGLLVGPLRILMGVCVLVLLIVCANVANLLLARATVREKEFSARLALGASRGRIARQVLTESLMLTGCGAAAGAWRRRRG